jgi:hypothetical protein
MATKNQLVITLTDREKLLLQHSLTELNLFLDTFAPEYIEETVWMMLYEALSNENADKWSSADRNIVLLFYFQINNLSHHLVNIDKLLADFTAEHATHS